MKQKVTEQVPEVRARWSFVYCVWYGCCTDIYVYSDPASYPRWHGCSDPAPFPLCEAKTQEFSPVPCPRYEAKTYELLSFMWYFVILFFFPFL